MKYEFLAKSSGTDPYQVVFTLDDRKLRVTCNCKAGIFGKLCKHKLALLRGDADMLFQIDGETNLKELLTIVPSTAYPELLEQIRRNEIAADEAKRVLQRSKKALEKSMKEGA